MRCPSALPHRRGKHCQGVGLRVDLPIRAPSQRGERRGCARGPALQCAPAMRLRAASL